MGTKKNIFLSVLLIVLIISGCVAWRKNYGKLKTIPKGPNHLTIQNLIDKWDDYHIYSSDQYAGPSFRSPLGIMFSTISPSRNLGNHFTLKATKADLPWQSV